MSVLTDAQWACLRKLGEREDQMMVCYGRGCGVKRHVVRALAGRGLAILDDENRKAGVCARITDVGRIFLGPRA